MLVEAGAFGPTLERRVDFQSAIASRACSLAGAA
jgi:hypothetical protein